MGNDADAILFYGYAWDDERRLVGHETEWQEVIAKSRGLQDPWASYPKTDHLPYQQREEAGSRWRAEHRAELDAWRQAKRDIAEEYGCEIGRSGSSEFSVPHICIRASEVRGSWDGPTPVHPDTMVVGSDWNAKLERFAADLSIDLLEAQGPGWFLVAYYG